MTYSGEFKDKIIGERIILRKYPVTFDMAKTLYALADESRTSIRVFLPWPDVTTKPEDSYAFLYRADEGWKKKEKAEYAIFHKESGVFMGGIGIMHFNEHNGAEIGYWLGTKFQGKGYMREAVRLIEDEYLPNLQRLVIRNDVENVRSANIPAKLGYHKDGVMRQAYKYADGHYGDMNVWSKLRSEWEKERG